ncbi:MAG TPA: DUF4442 domain-containing protein [Terriglobales bacterium]|nr:DUF4442 domain-containing protein [Terriglobales bacterium]
MGTSARRRESLRNKLVRWRINLFYFLASSGTRATYVSDDWLEAELTVKLNWRNRNYRGTIFGGTLYSALDPVYMLMIARNLGPEYSVWDTRATIHFKKAGRGKLYAHFRIEEAELRAIRELTAGGEAVERQYTATLVDREGTPHVVVEKTIYIRKRDPNKAHGKDRVSSMLQMR